MVTNVPYLGRGKQSDTLKKHLEKHYPEGKADLATAFVQRCLEFCQVEAASCRLGADDTAANKRQDAASTFGTAAMVTPQNWLFLTSYAKLRKMMLVERTWNLVARLGPGAFETISGEVVNVSLLVLTHLSMSASSVTSGLDVLRAKQPNQKAALLRGTERQMDEAAAGSVAVIPQAAQLRNPDAVVLTSRMVQGDLLAKYATSIEGLSTGDGDRFVRRIWESSPISHLWALFQGPPPATMKFGGRDGILYWENGEGELVRSKSARGQGQSAWSQCGIIVGQMSTVKCSIYTGEIHDKITGAIIPH